MHHDKDNARHYLADQGQDPDSARARSEAYISLELKAARGSAMHGRMDEALDHLGNALHTIEDSSSPAHVDDDRHPKVYPGPGHSPTEFWGDETTQALTAAIYQKMDQRIQAAWAYVFPAKP